MPVIRDGVENFYSVAQLFEKFDFFNLFIFYLKQLLPDNFGVLGIFFGSPLRKNI